MARYRRISERLRCPLAAVAFIVGVALLTEALWLGRGGAAYLTRVTVLVGSVVSWLMPFGRRVHPPSESTLQWACKQRREIT
jgi:hypothetical protein